LGVGKTSVPNFSFMKKELKKERQAKVRKGPEVCRREGRAEKGSKRPGESCALGFEQRKGGAVMKKSKIQIG